MCTSSTRENGRTSRDLVRVGVDSNLKIHIQYITHNGWTVRSEYVPPSDIMSRIGSMVGSVVDGDVLELHDELRDEIIEMLF